MEKKMLLIDDGVNSVVGNLLVNRLLPTKGFHSVGPIVFLDHVYPVVLQSGSPVPTGEFAHPHRGISTFSYVLKGSLSHYDSLGNKQAVEEGGIQWMKAGKGIVHEEKPFVSGSGGGVFQSLQFWINLPAAMKKQEPEYKMIVASAVTQAALPGHAGSVRVLLGELGSLSSPITTFGKEFIHHVKLNAKSRFIYKVKAGLEVAAFVPSSAVYLNGRAIENSKVVVFESTANEIVLENPAVHSVDVILFGGEPYLEPIVFQGPFVMNSQLEVAEAYRDFFDGRYGTIAY